jgi:DNA replication protein DnaC
MTGFAKIEVVTNRLDVLRGAWRPGDPLPEWEFGFDGEQWPRERLTEVFPDAQAPWAYDRAACLCGGRVPDCAMCGGTGRVCGRCGGTGFLAGHGALSECPCGLAQERYLKALSEESSFTTHMASWTFENVMADVPELVELALDVEEWTKVMITSESGWLFLNSLPGRGKSYLGACVLNRARLFGRAGVFFTAPELEEFLHDRLAPGGNRYESFLEWLLALKHTPLLVLDEYGAQHASPWVAARFRDILEFRSDRSGFLPTVLLTNMTDRDIPEWLLSRLGSPEVYHPAALGDLPDLRLARDLGLDSEEELEL